MIKILLSVRLGGRRMTQSALAAAAHIRPATLSHMYNEFCDRIMLNHLNSLCRELNCDVGDILQYIPDDEDDLEEEVASRKKG